MNDLNKHFSRSEFKSKADKWVKYIVVDCELINILEKIRTRFKRPVYINSGFRSKKFNATLKNSSPTSKHCLGMAADFKIKGIKPIEIYKYLDKKYPNCYGIGTYNTWIHLDIRPEKKRWGIK